MGVITPFITDTILCGRHHDLQAKGRSHGCVVVLMALPISRADALMVDLPSMNLTYCGT